MACDIQIVNPSVLNRIESYMADVSYREAIENSANYNTRLCIERRLRMPFLDSQTGVAQNHSNLFMSSRERIPGLQFGQVYTYPSKRWRKKRRQYLMQPQVRRCGDLGFPGGGISSGLGDSSDLHSISTMENPAAAPSEDSKDSAGIKDDSSTKASQDAWYYDELELQAMEGFDDPDPDSDYDYEETYSKRRKRRGGGGKPGRGASPADSGAAKKTGKGTGVGRGRKKVMNYSEMGDSEKPFSCDLCGARYKTRPGLTYHYTHSHKDGRCGPPSTPVASASSSSSSTSQLTPSSGVIPSTVTSSSSSSSSSVVPPPLDQDDDAALPPPSPALLQSVSGPDTNHPTQGGPGRRGRQSAPPASQQSAPPPVVAPPPVEQPEPQVPPPTAPIIPQTTANTPVATTMPEKISVPQAAPMPEVFIHKEYRKCSVSLKQILIMEQNEKERAVPSPYCDFCLGDAVSNKKSGQPEELLSCSDCGRSGHPTCLQFTDNMIVSVRKYRWQCIECKCCSICGTSDNDDQLLFCDDCDRGYHMYCLAPPLHTPPEGSWSCRLCIREFHSK
ncbi:double PHD fingers d4 isoform X3 [Rhodnius prolixus]|uniref:double PHD fingers d4 isoform X3 n=1 Tax=Rhodnius prolixus TaxID=13249 RepID=UPI003D18A860